MNIESTEQLDQLDFTKSNGLLPVVAQHAHTGEALMLAFANREALERTIAERVMWYYSRSRGTLWKKGETSGSVQGVVSLHADCDRDSVLARVIPSGPACHTGDWSCFGAPPTIAELAAVIETRAAAEPGSAGYTRRLLDDSNLRLKKLGEESMELALACERGDPARVTAEAADVLYHVLVACRGAGVTAGEILAELDKRRS